MNSKRKKFEATQKYEYFICDDGTVTKLDKAAGEESVVNPKLNRSRNKYCIDVYHGKTYKRYAIDALVAKHFMRNCRFHSNDVILHLDGDPANNAIGNLKIKRRKTQMRELANSKRGSTALNLYLIIAQLQREDDYEFWFTDDFYCYSYANQKLTKAHIRTIEILEMGEVESLIADVIYVEDKASPLLKHIQDMEFGVKETNKYRAEKGNAVYAIETPKKQVQTLSANQFQKRYDLDSALYIQAMYAKDVRHASNAFIMDAYFPQMISNALYG